MAKNKLVMPFLKWAGGKRQLLPAISKHLPKAFTTYYEPFIGGGAVLFHLQPSDAVINDFNEELVNCYQTIQHDIEGLIEDLKKHKNESEYFYELRELDRQETYQSLTNIQRASRIIYLNKTCFNGLYRVNNAGQFNAPFGRYKKPNIVNEERLRAVHTYLSTANVTILNGDYGGALQTIPKGAFVYFDPPYDPVSDSSNFTGYTKGGFDRREQKRLKEICDNLNERGVKFLLSNSATDFIKDLYKDYNIYTVDAKRSINSKGNKRGKIEEVLIKNYE